ncbi:MAG: membrane protein insertion efficiency factor YidD [Candidatus Electryonea clarkiae]|nr:membrane protein insertion efficiency factor YidD [Candidatus Electryonea clarkiae]MDP8285038.1 membrane protein insertion efficiency factor YidD [Candidatus Electryonea clarkiae]
MEIFLKSMRIFLLISCFLAIPRMFAWADEKEDFSFIINTNQIVENQKKPFKYNFRRNLNSSSAVLLLPIRLYQRFISSQDIPSCQFTPSCSSYGMKCLHRYGFFQGSLMTLDRLTRCNGLTRYNYPLDPKTNSAIDPPEENVLFAPEKPDKNKKPVIRI